MSAGEMLSLVGEAGFVFRGRAVRQGAEVDLGSAAAGKTATVEVEEVIRGTDILRDLTGRNVVVVSEDAADIGPAAEHVFFTNVVSLGDRWSPARSVAVGTCRMTRCTMRPSPHG
jgi:hypothetical protein